MFSDIGFPGKPRIELGRQMAAFHKTYDLVITPALPIATFDADAVRPPSFPPDVFPRAWTRIVYPFNLTQQPAISLPCGMTSQGSPAGLQIVGPALR